MRNGYKWLISFAGKNKATEIQKSWQYVFNKKEKEVQNILKDLAYYCNVFKSSFNENPYNMAFNEGARDVFLHILEMIDLDIKDLTELVKL